jgi:hypothetical protein
MCNQKKGEERKPLGHKKLLVEAQILVINFNNLHSWNCKPGATRISLSVIDYSKQDSILCVWIVNWHVHGDLSLTCYNGIL